jgi:hypothetical protein
VERDSEVSSVAAGHDALTREEKRRGPKLICRCPPWVDHSSLLAFFYVMVGRLNLGVK